MSDADSGQRAWQDAADLLREFESPLQALLLCVEALDARVPTPEGKRLLEAVRGATDDLVRVNAEWRQLIGLRLGDQPAPGTPGGSAAGSE